MKPSKQFLKYLLLSIASSILTLGTVRLYTRQPGHSAPDIRTVEAAGDVQSSVSAGSRAWRLPFSWWWVVTAGAAALVIGFSLLEILRVLARPLALLVLGIAVATALVPLIDWLEKRLPRLVAVILVYLVLILIFVGIGTIIFPPLARQVMQAVTQTPDLIAKGQSRLAGLNQLSGISLTGALSSEAAALGALIFSLPVRITSSLLDFSVVIFVSLYWLLSMPAMNRLVRSLFPKERSERIYELSAQMGEAMGGYLRGSVLNGLVMAVLSYIGFVLIGVSYPLVLGLIAGVAELLPVVGPILTAVIAVVLTLLQSPDKIWIVLVFVILLHQFENHILVPNIMRSQTDIPPLLSVLAIFAGGTIGGITGALVAIPLVSALRVLVDEVAAPAIRVRTGAQSGRDFPTHQ